MKKKGVLEITKEQENQQHAKNMEELVKKYSGRVGVGEVRRVYWEFETALSQKPLHTRAYVPILVMKATDAELRQRVEGIKEDRDH